jgi:hypothetical protein
LQREIEQLPEWTRPRDTATADLTVGPQGSWFIASNGRGELAHRPTLRRLLWALAQARHARPGEGSSIDALFAAGWPGESATAESASARVRTAIATLRRMGLGDMIRRGANGYFLDPEPRVDMRGL